MQCTQPFPPASMATMRISVLGVGLWCSSHSRTEGVKPGCSAATSLRLPWRMVPVKAKAQGVNPGIRKHEEKVVDSVHVTELSQPQTAYCRCWRSGAFPSCDGSHLKHNKETGDNVGPLMLKKQKE